MMNASSDAPVAMSGRRSDAVYVEINDIFGEHWPKRQKMFQPLIELLSIIPQEAGNFRQIESAFLQRLPFFVSRRRFQGQIKSGEIIPRHVNTPRQEELIDQAQDRPIYYYYASLVGQILNRLTNWREEDATGRCCRIVNDLIDQFDEMHHHGQHASSLDERIIHNNLETLFIGLIGRELLHHIKPTPEHDDLANQLWLWRAGLIPIGFAEQQKLIVMGLPSIAK